MAEKDKQLRGAMKIRGKFFNRTKEIAENELNATLNKFSNEISIKQARVSEECTKNIIKVLEISNDTQPDL